MTPMTPIWLFKFSSGPGHWPGLNSNRQFCLSVCLFICLFTPVARLTDKMDSCAKHQNDSPGSHNDAHQKKKWRWPAHQLCCVFLWGCLPSFIFLGHRRRIMLPSPPPPAPPLSPPPGGERGRGGGERGGEEGEKGFFFFFIFLAGSLDSASFIFSPNWIFVDTLNWKKGGEFWFFGGSLMFLVFGFWSSSLHS